MAASIISAIKTKLATKESGKVKVPTKLELQVSSTILELQTNSPDLSADLHDLYIQGAREIEIENDKNKSVILIFTPFKLLKKFQKVAIRLIRELEKKFGKHVIILASRQIQSKSYPRQSGGQVRARSRTLTSVHNAILSDVVYPAKIIGKRIRVRVDGNKLLRVALDSKDSGLVEDKINTFTAVYKKLTNKNVEFYFPSGDLAESRAD